MSQSVLTPLCHEDSSLSYAGIDRHEGEKMVGGYSTVITMEEYQSQRS